MSQLTKQSRFYITRALTATTAELVDITSILTGFTPSDPSNTTVDATTYADSVDVSVITGTSFGTISLAMRSPATTAERTIYKSILAAQNKVGRFFVAKRNGAATLSIPTLPVATDSVPSWTLPVGPYNHDWLECSIQFGLLADQGAIREIWRNTITITQSSSWTRGFSGDSAAILT